MQHRAFDIPLVQRLGWFVAFWALGVVALAGVALVLRLVMSVAGLST